ncbi:UNVERIFIED_CONTAM: 4Fe-4S binding protein [Acetivibrio alkalicellulosi]
MHVKIIYFSGTGNTKFISEKLVEKFNEKGVCNLDLIPVENAINNSKILESDGALPGIGFPVYDLMPPKIIIDFVNRLKKVAYHKAFVFSTYTSYPVDSNYYVIDKLQEKGYRVLVQESFKAPGASVYFYLTPDNPLIKKKTIFNRGVNNQLDNFVTTIMNTVNNDGENIQIKYNSLNKFHQVFSKMTFGIVFYSNLKTNSNCIKCGICAKICPEGNLIMKDGTLCIKNSNGCMKCLRCVQVCPNEAINFTSLKRKGSYTKHDIESAYIKANTKD